VASLQKDRETVVPPLNSNLFENFLPEIKLLELKIPHFEGI